MMPSLRERFISHPPLSHKSFEQLFKTAGIKDHKNGTPMEQCMAFLQRNHYATSNVISFKYKFFCL
jgi:hypothetical protein